MEFPVLGEFSDGFHHPPADYLIAIVFNVPIIPIIQFVFDAY